MLTLALPGQEIQEACLRALDEGVELEVDLDLSSEPFIWIGQITRTTKTKGAGRRALQRIIDIADENNLETRLACIEWNDSLISYYESMGFSVDNSAPDCGRDDDFIIMAREPN